MKIFISQPMTGLDEEDILFTRAKEKAKARLMFGDDVEFAPSYTSDVTRMRVEQHSKRADEMNWDIYWLVDSLRFMCTCDALWLVEGQENSKGCQTEREIAEMYGLDVYYPATNYKEWEDE